MESGGSGGSVMNNNNVLAKQARISGLLEKYRSIFELGLSEKSRWIFRVFRGGYGPRTSLKVAFKPRYRPTKVLVTSFLILIIILSITFYPVLAINDYGEDEDYLGQLVDNYVSDDNVSAAYNVINNSTLDCMELEYGSMPGMVLENFTLYTESDEGGGITVVNATYVQYLSDRSKTRYIYYDFGVDGLHNYKLYGYFRQDYHNQDAWTAFSMMSNWLGGEKQHRDVLEDHTFFSIGGTAGSLNLYEYDSGSFYSADAKTIPDGTDFWFKLEKNGVSFELDIYTSQALRDAEGNGDWYDKDLTLHEDYSFRYFYLVNNHDSGVQKLARYFMYDHSFNGTITGYEESGSYYTTEILCNDTGLVFMYNATIEANTAITAEFSTDNSTWVDHDNQTGSDTLVTGFESLDLRDINTTSLYMRFNMTTDGVYTPRIYQSRYVTITDVIVGVNIPQIDKIEFNTTIALEGCGVWAEFSDEEGLSGYIFWNNATSAPGGVNSSFTPLTGVSNSTTESLTLPASGTQFGARYYVNDTDDNWGVNTLVIFPAVLNETQACDYHDFNVSVITVEVGTLDTGNLASTYFIDADWYIVSEVNGAPGLDIRFNFSGISGNVTCGCIDVYQLYAGSQAHDIKVQVWNFTSSAWATIGEILHNVTADWTCIGLTHDAADVVSGGSVWARFYHPDNGHPPHHLDIDRIVLRTVYGTEVPEADIHPHIVSIVFNTTVAETGCGVRGVFTSEIELAGYIFWNNATSAPGGINSSWTALAGTTGTATENLTLPAEDLLVGATYYVNNSEGTWGIETVMMFPTAGGGGFGAGLFIPVIIILVIWLIGYIWSTRW